jgi:hypothetical protein
LTTHSRTAERESQPTERKTLKAYPEKVTDLKPDELTSPPVVLIDYRYLEGCPDEAVHAVNHLVDVFERLGGGAPRRETAVL